jgi:hypothetical protein
MRRRAATTVLTGACLALLLMGALPADQAPGLKEELLEELAKTP